ncbi:MAG: hypothetical protein RIS79_972 [Verrucomicrobiota bacterium]
MLLAIVLHGLDLGSGVSPQATTTMIAHLNPWPDFRVHLSARWSWRTPGEHQACRSHVPCGCLFEAGNHTENGWPEELVTHKADRRCDARRVLREQSGAAPLQYCAASSRCVSEFLAGRLGVIADPTNEIIFKNISPDPLQDMKLQPENQIFVPEWFHLREFPSPFSGLYSGPKCLPKTPA